MIVAAWTTTVSPTSQSENPYMPTWYETCKSVNQFVCCSSCRPPWLKLKRTSESIQSPTSASATSRAIEPAVKSSQGNSQTSSAPLEREVVRLVEVELVLEQVLGPGDPRDRKPAAAVEEECEPDPREPEPDCEHARDGLLGVGRRGERRRDDVE